MSEKSLGNEEIDLARSISCCETPADYREEYVRTSRELDEEGLSPQIFQHIRGTLHGESTALLQVELAFQEALANALEHGNLELRSEWREEVDGDGIDRFSQVKEAHLQDSTYADRRIQVLLTLADGILRFEIQDEGPGFDFALKSETPSDDVIQCHGRGLQLMYLVMDSIRYSEGGRRIELEKKLTR